VMFDVGSVTCDVLCVMFVLCPPVLNETLFQLLFTLDCGLKDGGVCWMLAPQV
jgi:hypothetical protein